jgi:acyl dehydratase
MIHPVAVFTAPADFTAREGQLLGLTDWVEIPQSQIQAFADATGDHQWIHVDVERAQQGPFGSTLAHGYLVLSLVNRFLPEVVSVENMEMGLNVGLDKVRFLSPVKSGARLRGRIELKHVKLLDERSVQATMTVTIELEGADRPACIAEPISRYYFSA